MTIRTISQLKETTQARDDSLFEVSEPGLSGLFFSKKMRYETLESQINLKLSSDIVGQYQMNKENGKKISLRDIDNKVDNLETKDMEIFGTKTFKKIPVCDAAYNEVTMDKNGFSLVNVNFAKQLIEEGGNFIGQNSILTADPDNDNNFTTDRESFLHFRIDAGGRDSSEYIDPQTGKPVGYAECSQSGNLIIYGWLADNGNVRPQDAWVALYGKILVMGEDGEIIGDDEEGKWVLLQLQPWIIGQKSQIMQYVSFNIPVMSGLKLKIKTGFCVNGTNTGLQQPNSLTFNYNSPNTFIGYIIGNLD